MIFKKGKRAAKADCSKKVREDKKHRSKRHLGLKARLYAAVGGVAALTVAAAAVAWVSYLNVEGTFTRMVQTNVPAMRSALQVSADTASLSAAAPSLAAAKSDQERETMRA